LNPEPVQFAELGVDCQLGVNDEFLGKAAGAPFPKSDDTEDLVIPLIPVQLGIGVMSVEYGSSRRSRKTPTCDVIFKRLAVHSGLIGQATFDAA
jgi:hypothetical protein